MNDRIYKTLCIVLFTGMFLNAYSQIYINEFQAYNASAIWKGSGGISLTGLNCITVEMSRST